MDTDALLIWNMKRGDEASMDVFVRRYYPVILRYCQYRLDHRADAEDLTQETFVHFFSSLPDYAHRGRTLNYLYTIAGNLCRDYYRAAARVSPAGALQDGQELPGNRPAHGLSADDCLLSEEPARQVDDCLDLSRALRRLPEELREVIILHYFQDLKQTDIATILGISLPLVKYRIRRAKELLQADLYKN